MVFFPSSLLLLSICFNFIDAWSVETAALRELPRSNSPRLTAITVRAIFQRREEVFVPKRHCEHSYADHASVLEGGRTRIAKTSMEYKLPALTLEDIETNLKDIQCSDSTVMIKFAEAEMFNAAKKSWENVSEFLIISSHAGCNQDGERSPHLVTGVEYNHETLTASFSSQRIQWKGSYESMTVKFGMSHGRYRADSLRIHEGLRRRKTAASSTSHIGAPTATPSTNTSAHADIGFQVPSGQEIFNVNNKVGSLSDSATVNCKSCFVSGTIDIVEGEITVSNSTTDVGKAVDFINSGFFRAVANNVSAHVEIDTSLSLSTTQSFNKTLTTIGIPGFEIPGIATVGPFFRPSIIGSITAQGQIDFSYGFDVKVPDNSSIFLNVGNLNQSSSQGFNNAQIFAIPLSASSPSISLTLGLGLRAELDLGIDILSGDGDMSAGAFVDLPSLKVTISNLAGVNMDCDPVSNITTADQALSHAFPNLTHIVPQVGIDVGLQVGAELNVPGFSTSIGTQTILAGTTFTLPTACLSFDGSKKTFASPTVTSTTTGAASTGLGSGSNSTEAGSPGAGGAGGAKAISGGGRTGENPLSGELAVWWMGCMLFSVSLVFLSL